VRTKLIGYLTAAGVLAGVSGLASSQVAPLRFEHDSILVDSGPLGAPADGASIVFGEVVESPGADWVRLWFGETVLPEGAELVITSAATGDIHRLTAETLAQWSNSSAYMAGDAVFVDLIMPSAQAGTIQEQARVRITGLDAGLPPIVTRTLCGTDDRLLSSDPRASRLAPQGCTAWLFNNRPNSAITANHCGVAGGDALWFNVPLRTSGGSVVPPAPEHQYPVENASVQDSGGSSIGDDWAVFGVFDNSNTGLSPVDAQLDSYILATAMPPSDGRPINVTGYGTTSSPIPQAWFAVQKSHTGPLFSVSGTSVRYRPDTTGGNSGSSVYDEQDARAIGIHTNGGCNSSPTSSNVGTSIANGGFRSAVMRSQSIAGGPTPGVIRLLDDAPTRIEPAGGTSVGVELLADFAGPEPQQGVTLHSNDGSGWVQTALNPGFAGDWFGAFPAMTCGADVSYYFSAVGANGELFTFPPAAPAVVFEAIATEEWAVLASADGQSDAGWSIENTGVSAGAWQRGVPSPTDISGGPRSDADGSGACWTTGLGNSVNLNGGPTRLVSPEFDLSGAADPFVDVSLWYNSDGSSERMDVEFSVNGGMSWAVLETLGSTSGWRPRTYRVADFAPGAAALRMRFSASDTAFFDVIEAGMDGFVLRDTSCGPAGCNTADFAEPFGILDLLDIQEFIEAFLNTEPEADLAEPFGNWDLADLTAFVVSFTAGCP